MTIKINVDIKKINISDAATLKVKIITSNLIMLFY